MIKDIDMREFHRRVEDTPEGQRYLYAWKDMHSCVAQIRLAHGVENLAQWRLRYIKASENAGRCLELLERQHHWPA